MKKILFDQGTPLPLRRFLAGYEVQTAFTLGWHNLSDGELIDLAEVRFDVIITTDRNWKYQQRLINRRVAIVVLPSGNWPILQSRVDELVNLVRSVKPGDFVEM